MLKWPLIVWFCALMGTLNPHATCADDWTPRPIGESLGNTMDKNAVFAGGVVLDQVGSIVIRFDTGRFDRYSMPLGKMESLNNAPQVSTDGRWVAVSTDQERELGDYPAELPDILYLDRRTRRVTRLAPGAVAPDDWFLTWALSHDGKQILIASMHFLRVYDAPSLKLLEKRAWPMASEPRKSAPGLSKTATHSGTFDLRRNCFRLTRFWGSARKSSLTT